ncbi:MAG: thioredoxin family protein [Candidatus Moranbacteria bacterium]|nr:thioredoxin family protein [Candidatus Moranbacteria bacterium]
MNIKILGTGCPNCQKLEQNTKQALKELNIDARVEKITDIQEIMSHGIMSTPAIVADGEIISYGLVPSVDEIKKLLTK